MKRLLSAVFVVAFVGCAGCVGCATNPDSIREHTADATAAAKRSAKAVAQGVFEGLARKGPVNINKATKEQLLTLPEVTSAQADAIIAGRPYTNSAQLLRKRILPKTVYEKNADRLVAK